MNPLDWQDAIHEAGDWVFDSAYEPVKTRAAPLPSVVQPRACHPVGNEAVGEGDAEVVLLEVVLVVAGVVDEEEDDDDEELEDEDEDEEGAAEVVVPACASFRKILILYPPPQIVPGSPPHLEVHPSLAGTKLAADPHQHSCPYSTPAYGIPFAEHDAIQPGIVRLLELVAPPFKARLDPSST